ncbi:MAG: zinc metalloprotease [Candidatus Hodarchaeota archaeon]
MKKRMLLAGIAFSAISAAILLFGSPAISADVDIEKFSPLSEQNKPVLTGDWNIISFLQPDGQLGTGYRCGTLPPTVEQAEAVQRAIDERGVLPDIPCTVTIPVAFHILRHDDSVTGDVTDQQISDQIDVLNSSYAPSSFQFVLHSIERVNNTTWSELNTTSVEVEVKQALAVSPATTLNVYTCTDCQGYLGWSYFPNSFPEDHYMHGVVALYSSFPGGSTPNYNEGDTVTHEAGHYLGLYHTFQGGCTPPGDYCDDTPYEQSPAYGCPEGRDTCPQEGEDPIHNFMDYTYDYCMDHFTGDQSARMDDMVEVYKPSLITCGALPQIFWSDEGGGMVFFKLVDMGTFWGNEWGIVVKNYADMSGNWGLGMMFYNPSWNEFGIDMLADDYWVAHGLYGVWLGDGTPAYFSIAYGGQGVWTLHTSAPPRPGASISDSAGTVRK